MAKSESIEALLTPSLRVSRPVAACARCRSAKIKCDGKLPACSACERSGKAASCSSANDEFARGKERSYVAALEAAAQRLQKKIDTAKTNDTEIPSSSVSRTFTSPSNRPSQARRISGTRRREASDVNELVSDFGFLTVNATSRDFHGFTSEMSFAKMLLSMATKKDLTDVAPSKLPARYTVVESLEHYFQRVFVLFPFFSETDFMSSVSRVYQDTSHGIAVTALDFWYVRLVLAISNASRSQIKGDRHDLEASQHMAAAMELVDYVLHPGSISGVQALLLLVQYALLDPAHFDSWYLIGMASRLVVDLGLHCEPSVETKIDRDRLDLRRRIFHSTYALDRLISMSLGRAFSFTDDSASGVPFPDYGSDTEGSPSPLFMRSLKPSLYLFDIRRVQSAFYMTTAWSSRTQWSTAQATSYASSVSGDIHAWYSSIPPSIAIEHLTLLNLERLYSQIWVVAPNQKAPIVNMTDLNKALVFEYSAQFADKLYPVTQDSGKHAFLTYADICRARWVGKQFLEIMWSDFDRLLKTQHLMIGNNESSSSPQENCNRAINCLRKITDTLDFSCRRWDVSDIKDKFTQETAVLLGRLKNRQQEFSASQYTASRPGIIQPMAASQYNTNPHQSTQGYAFDATVMNSQPLTGLPYGLTGHTTNAQNNTAHLSPPLGNDYVGSQNLPNSSMPRRSYEFLGGKS